MRDQLIKLLSTGATREEAIKIVGCADDFVTQCLADPVFMEELKEKRDAHRQELIESSYARLEHTTLNKINKEIEYADIPALCRILETTAKNRLLHKNPSGHFQNPTAHLTVELRLPHGAQVEKVVVDHNTNQIVAIGDRSMAGMPINGVQKLFKELENKEQQVLTAKQQADIVDADIQQDLEGANYDQPTAPTQAAPVARAA